MENLTGTFTDSRDGKTYKTVKIGNQIWMAENLAYKAEVGCYAYDDNEKKVDVYGYLYNWKTAIQVCPDGWHLPNNEEWKELLDYLGSDGHLKNEGTVLKASQGWDKCSDGTDDFGFTALPNGHRSLSGEFLHLGSYGRWWSGTETSLVTAWCYEISCYIPIVRNKDIDKPNCIAIRCIKNNEPQTVESKNKGKDYNSIKIGDQEWMLENLNVDKFRNGDPIPEAKSNDEWKKAGEKCDPAWCYYDNDAENGKVYGKLYNWFAVIDPRGLTPEGWHIPSDDEWKALEMCLGMDQSDADADGIHRNDVSVGAKLKESGTEHWASPNKGATNESGFTALPGGLRINNGSFNVIGNTGFWWSATEHNTYADFVWSRLLGYNHSAVNRDPNDKPSGFSVRCVKD